MAFITTNDQIKEANSSVTVDLSINSLQSFLADAEDKFRVIIGITAFEELESKTDKLAYKKMCAAIVNMALHLYADSGQLLISDSGMHVTKTDSRLPASDKKIVAFKRGVYKKAWVCFETCIFLMEVQKADFPVWNLSPERKRYISSFINVTSIFNDHSSIRITEDLFQLLRSEIRAIERDSIIPLLGFEVYNSLKQKLFEGTNLSEVEAECVDRIRLAIAPLAFAESIPYQLIEVTSTGIFQVSEAALSSQSDNIEARNIPNQRTLQRIMNRLISSGESELESLRKWLNDNKTSFDGYKDQMIAPMAEINKGLEDTGIYFM